MITEDYVSFETAKLLKEKWFDEECNTVYSEYGELHEIFDKEFYESTNSFITLSNSNYNDITRVKYRFFVTAPTLQMAMKWLREEHRLHISAETGFDVDNHQYYFFAPSVCRFSDKSGEYESPFGEKEFDTYEEACEAGIRYALENLI